ncbi:MAG: GntR family transcriptional regulator [Candidatus Adiutrix sp.]|jgi:GntR family transcriptional regulator|nr:GntR family transcriptional regulator [Candidatus Adiutrix sp.]
MKVLKDNKRLPADGHAYLRLADQIKQEILDGTYKPGDRIPTETALVKSSGLSSLTVRQALGVLVEEDILERFIGRGTFVKELNWQKASFHIDGLLLRIDPENTRIRIIRSEVRHASEDMARKLGLALGDAVIYIKKIITSAQAGVFLIQEGHLKPDLKRPVMEAELEATYLNGLFTGSGNGLIKRADLLLSPVIIDQTDAELLSLTEISPGFRLDYTFFDAESSPLAVGFFLTPQNMLTLNASIGIKGCSKSREN